MNIDEIHKIAHIYTDNLGEVIPGFKLGIGDPQLFEKHVYFGFILQCIRNDGSNEAPAVGGAPGIVVDKDTGEIEMISFSQLAALQTKGNIK